MVGRFVGWLSRMSNGGFGSERIPHVLEDIQVHSDIALHVAHIRIIGLLS